MFHYTNEQLASVIALPIVTILLVWTTAIFQKNRKKWGPYDIPIVSLLILSIIRNMTILAYTLFVTLNQNTIDLDYCSGIIWIFNSVHTFQASSLSTLAIIGLFSMKLHRKQQQLKQYLTSTHVIYHLFCLTTLCACVGVAAILAQDENNNKFKFVTIFETNPCKFMPFDLDIKYNVFIIVLNVFLAAISLIAFFSICYYHYKIKHRAFDYLKKSNSDLSEISLGNDNNNKQNFYDTYTIQRGVNHHGIDNNYFDNGNNGGVNVGGGSAVPWNSDMSNISTTVSSTNSRRPCINNKPLKEEEDDKNRTGLETIHPVLIVCYLFYHIPLIVLCIFPHWVRPWPVAAVALWLGLIQDVLIPVSLGIVDSRFCKWVSYVYKCNQRRRCSDDKLPHVGLDGKFRPFGSQPQSLDISQNYPQRVLQTVEHRFPITNGSLYTSIDGRLPVIHNYRRNKEQRNQIQTNYHHQSSQLTNQHEYSCRSCEMDTCPSHSNLHHLTPHYINKQLNLIQQQQQHQQQSQIELNRNDQKRMSMSQENVRNINNNFITRSNNIISRTNDDVTFHHHHHLDNNNVIKNSRNLLRLNRMRLCKSEDSLNEINREFADNRQKQVKNEQQILDVYSSSDDDDDGYIIDTTNQNFDSLSSRSSFSITTEANCDFDFYQNNNNNNKTNNTNNNNNINNNSKNLNKNVVKSKITTFKPPAISRSNSKRSIDNFMLYQQQYENPEPASPPFRIQRSNSYITTQDRTKYRNNDRKILRSNSKLSDCSHMKQKIKSVEYLPSLNNNLYVEDVFYFNYPNQNNYNKNYIGSVPDLKKVFISEYI